MRIWIPAQADLAQSIIPKSRLRSRRVGVVVTHSVRTRIFSSIYKSQIQAILFPISKVYPIKICALLDKQDVLFFLFQGNLLMFLRHFKQQLPKARARINLTRTLFQKTHFQQNSLKIKKKQYSGLFSIICHPKVSTLSSHYCI